MTARKFVVSKRGVQREVRRPKASARERLAHVEPPRAIEVKLTKAQLRELAPLFAAAWATYNDSDGRERGAIYAQPFERGALKVGYLRPRVASAVRAAILGPQRKRGAR